MRAHPPYFKVSFKYHWLKWNLHSAEKHKYLWDKPDLWDELCSLLCDLTNLPSLVMESQIRLYNHVEEQKQEQNT